MVDTALMDQNDQLFWQFVQFEGKTIQNDNLYAGDGPHMYGSLDN